MRRRPGARVRSPRRRGERPARRRWQGAALRRRQVPGFALVLAAVVLLIGLTVLRPVVNSAILSGRPIARLRSISRSSPTSSARTRRRVDRTGLGRCRQVTFAVADGDTASTIAERLEEDGLIRDQRAFIFIAHERDLAGDLQTGRVPVCDAT